MFHSTAVERDRKIRLGLTADHAKVPGLKIHAIVHRHRHWEPYFSTITTFGNSTFIVAYLLCTPIRYTHLNDCLLAFVLFCKRHSQHASCEHPRRG